MKVVAIFIVFQQIFIDSRSFRDLISSRVLIV